MGKRTRLQRFLSLALAVCIMLSMAVGMTGSGIADGPDGFVCELEEHTHDAACYAASDSQGLDCAFEAHTHDRDACYDAVTGALMCQLAEFALHRHDDACYDANGALVCQLAEYWVESRVEKACGDVEGHAHDVDCYERRLVCGFDYDTGDAALAVEVGDDVAAGGEDAAAGLDGIGEPDAGVDDGSTGDDVSDGLDETAPEIPEVPAEPDVHVHDDSCYEENLICDRHVCDETCEAEVEVIMTEGRDAPVALVSDFVRLDEHQHDVGCFGVINDAVNAGELICGKPEHVHDGDCYAPVEGEQMNQFITDADAFLIELNAGKYDAEPETGRKLLNDFADYRETIDVTGVPDEQLNRFYACLDRLERGKQAFEARVAKLAMSRQLAEFMAEIDKLEADIAVCEDVTEEALAAFQERITALEAVRDEIVAALLDVSEQTKFNDSMAKLAALKEALGDVSDMASPSVEVQFQARIRRYLGAAGTLSVTVKPVQEYTGVSLGLDGMTGAESTQNGVISCPAVKFTVPGTYEFTMQMNPSAGNRVDTRTYNVRVVIGGFGSEVQLDSIEYKDPTEMYDVSSEYASFVALGNKKTGYSSAAYDKADEIMETLTMEERLGQLFMLHYPGDGSGTAAQARKWIEDYAIGSYLVFAPMFESATPASVRAKIDDAQGVSKVPMLFSVDEEGGRVVRISKYTQFRSTPFPYPQDLKAAGNGTTSAVAGDVAEKVDLLTRLGLNINLAPVADVSLSDGYIWSRTWGADTWTTGDYVAACVKAYDGTGVGNALKHFPGYGRTSSDTHADFAVNFLPEEAIYWHELVPFYAGVDAGADSILVTHNILNAFDTENPCSLSPAVYRLAREWLGYDGVIMTDDLGMSAITKYTSQGYASLRALQAGADIAMTPSPDSDIPVALAAMRSGELSEAEVNAKCRRVLAWKAELGLLDDVTNEPEAPAPGTYDAVWWAPGETMPKYYTSGDVCLTEAAPMGGRIEVYRSFYAYGRVFSKNMEIDLRGNCIEIAAANSFKVTSGANLTIKDTVGQITDTKLPVFTEDSQYDFTNMKLHYVALRQGGNEARVADFSKAGRLEIKTVAGQDGLGLVVLEGGTFTAQNIVLRKIPGVASRRGITTDGNVNNNIILENSAVVGFGHGNFTSASVSGGGIYMTRGQLHMNNSYVVGNTGRTSGGIDLGSNCVASINDSVIARNVANINGGGIYVRSGASCTLKNSVVTSNLSTHNGGNIYVNGGTLNVLGDTSVSYGTTNCGGGIFGWGGGTNIVLSGFTTVADNLARACGGGINIGYDGSTLAPANNLTLSGHASVRDNKSEGFAGGIYSNAVSNMLIDSPSTANNKMMENGAEIDCNWYLLEGQKLRIPQHFGPNAAIRVYTASDASEIPVIEGSNYAIESTNVGYLKSDRHGYDSMLKSGVITFVGAERADIACKLVLDGNYYEFCRVSNVWTDNDGKKYVCLNDMVRDMGNVDFDIAEYTGVNIVGVQKDGSDSVTMPSSKPFFKDGLWYAYLPDGTNLTKDSIVVLSNPVVDDTNTIPFDALKFAYGHFSVRVKDMYAASGTGFEDESFIRYIPAGGSAMFDLSERTGEWVWKVGAHDDDDFIMTSSKRNGRVYFDIRSINAPVVIFSGSTADVRYTVQYYGQVRSLKFYNTSGDDRLQIINTTGGVMPKTGETDAILQGRGALTYLRVNSGEAGEVGAVGEVETQETLQKLYSDRSYIYSDSPTLIQVDRLFTDDHYELEELWILKEGRNPESVNREDWDVYNKTELGLESIHDLKLTNSPDFAVMNDTILVPDDGVMRMVYHSTAGTHDAPTTFYDYDITDGYVYDANDRRYNTSQQYSLSGNLKMKTERYGINADVNYSGRGEKLAFGNASNGVVWSDALFQGGWFNRYDRVKNTYRGCAFGLVTGLDSNDNLIYADGIDAPKLFNEGSALGKTTIDGYDLRFRRYGDAYTLSAVTGTSAVNLCRFNNPVSHTGQVYTHIWTNNFWPADDFATFGADGHDMKIGDRKQSVLVPPYNSPNLAPVSDDGQLHNYFFGMSFQVKFALPEGYEGALEYVFFGDDDMWIFLDGKLVLDVGGVHSSVGEYVNLWDYIQKGDTSEHTLQVYYTERGASGSTCWMHFTVPKARFIADDFADGVGNLKIAKSIEGDEANRGSTYLFDVDITDADGNPVDKTFSCVLYNKTGEPAEIMELENGHGTMGISRQQVLNILYIPVGWRYTVSEHEYECDTRVVVDGVVTEGLDISGVITQGKSNQVEFVNDFDRAGPRLPSVGGTDHSPMIAGIGSAAVLLSVLAWPVREKRRRSR